MEQQVNLYQPVLGASKHLFSAYAIAVATACVVVTLAGIAAFALWRVRQADHLIAAAEKQQAVRVASTARTLDALHGRNSMETLQATAQKLATDISNLQQILLAVHHGSADAASGFSARLTALGRQRAEGVWLTRVVLAAGEQPLALVGAAVDPKLVGRYLGGLAIEPTLGGAHFNYFALRQPKPDEPVAATMFEVGDLPAPAAATGLKP
jgi:hypothetical protein